MIQGTGGPFLSVVLRGGSFLFGFPSIGIAAGETLAGRQSALNAVGHPFTNSDLRLTADGEPTTLTPNVRPASFTSGPQVPVSACD